MNDPEDFEIEYYGKPDRISINTMRSARIFHIAFGNRQKRLPLVSRRGKERSPLPGTVYRYRRSRHENKIGKKGQVLAAKDKYP